MCEWGAVMLSPGPHFIKKTYIPRQKHILSFCITCKLSGWRIMSWKGTIGAVFLKRESVERVSMGARLHSKLPPSGHIKDPPLLHTHTHSSHQPSCLILLQQAFKHAKTPAVFAANQHPVRSRPGIANILEAWFKYHSAVSASLMCR